MGLELQQRQYNRSGRNGLSEELSLLSEYGVLVTRTLTTDTARPDRLRGQSTGSRFRVPDPLVVSTTEYNDT